MTPRRLLDPITEGGGGTSAAILPATTTTTLPVATPPTVPVAAVAPGLPEPTPSPKMVHVSPDEYSELIREREAYRAAQEKAEADRLRAVAAKEGADAAMGQLRAGKDRELEVARNEKKELERRWYESERDRTVGEALAGANFVSEKAAQQVRQLLQGRFQTRPSANGGLEVVDTATGRIASEVVKELLGTIDYAHFLKPTTAGGTGPARVTTGNLGPQTYKTAGEELVARIAAMTNPSGKRSIGVFRDN